MKKLLSILTMLVLSISMYAQREVTKFLGIPVDGTKSEMIRKLKAKGFKKVPYTDDVLTGEFNGREVYISVQTNNNKVRRIAILDTKSSDEIQIKNSFNILSRQFRENPKYITIDDASVTYSLSYDYDVYQEIKVQKKQIQAVFCQKTSKNTLDDADKRCVWFMIAEAPSEYDKYVIVMYYENIYNAANGEDL